MIYLLSLIDSSMVLHTYFIRRDLLKVRNKSMSEVGVLLIYDVPVCNREKKTADTEFRKPRSVTR